MSKGNKVFVGSNFVKSLDAFEEISKTHDEVELLARDQCIQTAIALAEFIIKRKSINTIIKYSSSI